MAKRSYPYSEDYIPQIKVHVGEKQFRNNGIKLQQVYEKTLDLLYQGARKCNSISTPQEKIVLSDVGTSHNKKRKFKQLQIGRNGCLEQSADMLELYVLPFKCMCGCLSSERCAYCDTHMCTSCLHLCGRCQHTFCYKCVLYRSEGLELCVSCT